MSSSSSCKPIADKRETLPNVCAHFGSPAAASPQPHTSGNITEREKNVATEYLSRMALDALDCELKIIDMEARHRMSAPVPVPAPTEKSAPSLHLIPKHRYLGVMGMTEILTAMQLLGGIGSSTGNDPTTIAFADVFEQTFGFSFNDIYDRQIELFKRLPCNLTKTLDAMKAALIKEYRRRQAAKKEKDSNGIM